MVTRLDLVAKVYIDIMVKVSQVYFTNDFGTEQGFDAKIHSEVHGGGALTPDDRCLVIFPAALLDTGGTGNLRVVSKRFVMATQAHEELESLKQSL